MKNSVENTISIGVAASVLMLIALGFLSYRTTTNLVTTENWISHTHEVMTTLESGLSLISDAEAEQRAFLLTGEASFLNDSRDSQTKINDWLQRVRQLTADNPAQQQRLNILNVTISQRLAALNSRSKLRQQGGLEAATEAAGLHQGKELMNQVWRGISDMRDAENQLLMQREHSAQTSAENSLCVIVAGGTLASLIGLGALVIVRRDLGLREQAQREIKESQSLMALILDNIPALVFIKDLNGHYLFVNRRFGEIAGLPRTEIHGRTVFDISKKEAAQTANEYFRTVLQTGKPVEFETTVLYPDGPHPHQTLKFPIRDGAGKITAVAGISTDITERKQVERMRLQFQNLFESAPGLYLVLKPDLTIVAVSDAYLKATMTRRETILGRGIFEIFPDNPDEPEADGASNLRASFERVLLNAKADTMPIQKYDVRWPDGTFEERFWSPINSPILGLEGQVEYIIHRVEDVTEFILQKQRGELPEQPDMRERLQQMEAEIFSSSQEVKNVNEQLRVANQELEAFSYSVSHDLRSPLRHIDGFVDLLRKQSVEKLDERGARYLNIIASAARQMGTLIDDLLVFSRMSRSEIRHTQVASNSLLDEAVKAAQNDANGRQIHWKISPLPEVKADPSMLRQVWMNLISNAVKYTRTRPVAEIEVGCQAGQEDELIFFVRDNGVGFDMNYVHKLFGVFQRLHRADEFEGTGIGLANVRRIVSRHGGRTWAEGKLDQGATFFFSLPKNIN